MIALYLIIGHLSLFVSPLIALFMGAALSLAMGNPHLEKTQHISRKLLLYCFVGSALGVDLVEISQCGVDLPTLATVLLSLATLICGFSIAKPLGVADHQGQAVIICATICAGALSALLLSLGGGLWLPLPLFVAIVLFEPSVRGAKLGYLLLAFFVALLLRNYAPLPERAVEVASRLSTRGTSAMLFLFGLGITSHAIRSMSRQLLLLLLSLSLLITLLISLLYLYL